MNAWFVVCSLLCFKGLKHCLTRIRFILPFANSKHVPRWYFLTSVIVWINVVIEYVINIICIYIHIYFDMFIYIYIFTRLEFSIPAHIVYLFISFNCIETQPWTLTIKVEDGVSLQLCWFSHRVLLIANLFGINVSCLQDSSNIVHKVHLYMKLHLGPLKFGGLVGQNGQTNQIWC